MMETGLQPPPVRVSAVIPTYNRAADLKRALDSVLSQTVPVAEIIVVDDGSTDNTKEVVARFGSRVAYIHQNNAGAAAARNRAIRMATGEWLAFLDSDDWWMPEKIRLQVEALHSNPRAVLAYTSAWIISPDGTREMSPAVEPSDLWPTLRHSNLIASCSSVMVRREAVVAEGGFDESLSLSDDWDLWIRLAQKHPFAVVSEPVTAYMITPNSLSQDPQRTLSDTEHMLEGTLLCGLRGPSRVIWRRKIRAAQLCRAAINARGVDRALELRILLRSLAQWPSPFFFFRRWKMLAVYILRRKAAPSKR
jgi:glycosyltransferase involved in cell wall biosynthesis